MARRDIRFATRGLLSEKLAATTTGAATGDILYFDGTDWIVTTAVNIDPAGEFILRRNGTDWLESTSLAVQTAAQLFDVVRADDVAAGLRVVNSRGGFHANVRPTDGRFRLGQTNTVGGYEESWMEAERNGPVTLFNNGDDVFRTQAGGIDLADQTGQSDPFIGLYTGDFGTRNAFIQAHGTTTTGLRLRNEVQDGHVVLEANITGPATRTLFRGDPNGETELYHDGTLVMESWAQGERLIHSTAPFLRFGTATITDDLGQLGSSGGDIFLDNFSAGNEIKFRTSNTAVGVQNVPLRLGTAGSTASAIGFHNTTPIIKPSVTGSRGGNAALASLLTALANYGLITDSST